jgi:hypothetical protein
MDVTLLENGDVYRLYSDTDQWRTQKYLLSGGGGYAWIYFSEVVQQIQLKREGRENRDLGVVERTGICGL